VSSFHEEVIRFGGDCFPFAVRDVDGAEAVVIGALADERHTLSLPHVIFNGVVEALVRFAETHLIQLSPRIPSGHRAKRAPAPSPLSLSRPGDKYLTGPLEAPPSTEELCQGDRSKSVGWDRGEQNEHCLALSDVDVLRLVDKPEMPAKRSPLVLRQLSVGQQERELEGFCQADELKLRRGRQRFGDVPTIQRSAEAVVSGALRSHERMFAHLSA
jgi:hypothetical protein